MASLSYHETLKIFIAALMTVSVLAADQDCSNLGSVRVMCNATLYPDLCYNSLVSKTGPNAKPQLIYKQSAEVALSEVSKALYPDSCQNSCNFTSSKDLCEKALYPDSYQNSLANVFPTNLTTPDQLQPIFKQSVLIALSAVSKASPDFATNGTIEKLVTDKMPNSRLALSAVESCRILFSLAIDNINNTLSSSQELMSSHTARFDMRIWLSAAETDVQTCADGFNELVYDVSKVVHDKLDNITKYASNSLAVVSRIDSCLGTKIESNKYDTPH